VTDDIAPAARMTLESDVDRLAEVRAFVRETATSLGASKRSVEDLVQAVDEASCNIMLHGYGGKPGPIEVGVERRGDAIAVRLVDRARPFDPTAGPTPDPAAPPRKIRPGGMGVGIHLLRTMMDEVHHAARPDGGNELTLVRSVAAGEED
jgi:anti-sigma regulatory factor (Ser/Thr protein kinase)